MNHPDKTAPVARARVLVFAESGADYRTLCERLRESFSRAAAPVDVVPVTAAQMRAPGMMDADKTLGFFLPGASHADYDTKLGPDNIAALRRFVHDGGRFMGICAGAYYACREIGWYEYDPALARRKTPGIDFFNHHARGPIRDLIFEPGGNTSYAHVAPAMVTLANGLDAALMYWGGPRLVEGLPAAHRQDRVIARFRDLDGRPPAIVMRDIGKGRAVISAVHPEVRGADFAAAVHGDGLMPDRARHAGRELARYEPARRAVWDYLINALFPEIFKRPQPAPRPQI